MFPGKRLNINETCPWSTHCAPWCDVIWMKLVRKYTRRRLQVEKTTEVAMPSWVVLALLLRSYYQNGSCLTAIQGLGHD